MSRESKLALWVLGGTGFCLLALIVVVGLGVSHIIQMRGLFLWVSRTLLVLMMSGAIFSMFYMPVAFGRKRR